MWGWMLSVFFPYPSLQHHKIELGFSNFALLTSGPDNSSLLGTVLCVTGDLAASLASTHQMLVGFLEM